MVLTCESGEWGDGYCKDADGQVGHRHVADEDVRAAPHLWLPDTRSLVRLPRSQLDNERQSLPGHHADHVNTFLWPL